MQPVPRFEILEHTADVGVVGYGANMGEAFAQTAEGMFSLMVDLSGVAETVRREISVSADDREALLVDWLNELLYVVDVDRLVFRRFAVTACSDTTLRASAFGERIDPARHQFRVAVKAATYHLVAVDAGPPWRAQVILDL